MYHRLFILHWDGVISSPIDGLKIPDRLFNVSWGPLYIGGVPDRPFYHKLGINITSFTGSIDNIERQHKK